MDVKGGDISKSSPSTYKSGRGSMSGLSIQEDGNDEDLDPRIQVELEKLNEASNAINALESALDEARSLFRQELTESTQQLNNLSKKLGVSIEKARPYYEARLKAKEAQNLTQEAALKYERACSQLAAAKEMVHLAEQGFFVKKGQQFDPAWQEMLNHATVKVNDAEKERFETELEHQETALVFNDAEQEVKLLHKNLKRFITKSRPYFDTKAKFNQHMEERKNKVGQLEKDVTRAKTQYGESLKALERISDNIHQQRNEAKLRKEMGVRGAGVGAETPSSPEENYRITQDSSQQSHTIPYSSIENPDTVEGISDNSQIIRDKSHYNQTISEEYLSLPNQGKDLKRNTFPLTLDASVLQLSSYGPVRPKYSMTSEYFKLPQLPSSYMQTPDNRGCSEVAAIRPRHSSNLPQKSQSASALDQSKRTHGPIIKVSTEGSLTKEEAVQRANEEVMETIQRSKPVSKTRQQRVRPHLNRDDSVAVDSGEDSQSESVTSTSVFSDDQIEGLLAETLGFEDFVSQMDTHKAYQYKRMSLPRKLSYLEDHLRFSHQWVDLEDEKKIQVVSALEKRIIPSQDETRGKEVQNGKAKKAEIDNAKETQNGKAEKAQNIRTEFIDNITSSTEKDGIGGVLKELKIDSEASKNTDQTEIEITGDTVNPDIIECTKF